MDLSWLTPSPWSMLMADTPKLPLGASDWNPPTDTEIEAAAQVSESDITDAKEAAKEQGGMLNGLLNATEYKG